VENHARVPSARHHPTDIHRRQQRKKKRNKLRARIAAAPSTATPVHHDSTLAAWLSSWLEQFDGIAIGIFDLNLSASGTGLHVIAKRHAGVLERVDLRRQIRDAEDHSIPSARLLGFAAGQRARARCSRPTEQQPEISERYARKSGKLLMFQSEAEMVGVEGRGPRDICHLVTDAVQTEDAS
jgi:hypothetical protein